MRIAVAGGRDHPLGPIGWVSLEAVRLSVEAHGDRIDVVLHGAAAGADTSAGEWAKSNGIAVDEHPVKPEDWQRLGRRAGILRTNKMLDAGVDAVVIFPGGRGTAHTEAEARRRRVKVVDCQAPPCKLLSYTDARWLAERQWSDDAFAGWYGRARGIGLAVAQVGALHGAALPARAIYVGGDHHHHRTSPLAMPCSTGDLLGPEDAVAWIRRRWCTSAAFREAMEAVKWDSILVCSCGSRGCLVPVLATAVASTSCAKELGSRAPSRVETRASLVRWSALAMAHCAVTA